METIDYRNQNISKDLFVKLINDTRKGKKDRWYAFVGNVEGRSVSLKGFNTTLQIFKVEGLQQNTVSDISVSEFKKTLLNPFN